jgi:hypothetical protein
MISKEVMTYLSIFLNNIMARCASQTFFYGAAGLPAAQQLRRFSQFLRRA